MGITLVKLVLKLCLPIILDVLGCVHVMLEGVLDLFPPVPHKGFLHTSGNHDRFRFYGVRRLPANTIGRALGSYAFRTASLAPSGEIFPE